jgi:hypothetical protein
MKYFNQIEIQNFEVIQEKTKKFLEPHSSVRVGFYLLDKDYLEYCPEILSAFADYNLKVKKVALYVTFLQEHSKVHIDYKSNLKSQCRINIPILNCEGSRTEFYSGGEYTMFFQQNGIPYYLLKDNSIPTKVAEVEIIRPTVIRVQEPHRVHTNMNTVPRICMTVATDIDPVFLLT